MRHIANVEGSPFARVVLAEGFSILPLVPQHNHEPEYPVTFIGRIPT